MASRMNFDWLTIADGNPHRLNTWTELGDRPTTPHRVHSRLAYFRKKYGWQSARVKIIDDAACLVEITIVP